MFTQEANYNNLYSYVIDEIIGISIRILAFLAIQIAELKKKKKKSCETAVPLQFCLGVFCPGSYDW